MTEPDEACLTAAQVIYDNLECRLLADESTNKEHRIAERDDLAIIAAALMAERERAKAEERDRCAELPLSSKFCAAFHRRNAEDLVHHCASEKQRAHYAWGETARDILAAIRKGEHNDAD